MARSKGPFLLLLFALSPALAAILPEQWAGATRGAVSRPALTDRRIWDEYGVLDLEQAEYAPSGGATAEPATAGGEPEPLMATRPFTIQAFRLRDATSAMAAFQWQVPAGAQIPNPDQLLARMPDGGAWAAFGNYLLRFLGIQPAMADVTSLVAVLPRLEDAPLPVLPGYLPADGLVAGSRRYVFGPDALAAFEPKIAPSLAAFHTGAEGQLAEYRFEKGPVRLAIFSYPTPAIAKERFAEFSKLPGTLTKRSGTLVVALLDPPDLDEAERLLAKIRFQGHITWNERTPTRRDNLADLILNVFLLVGVLMAFFLVAGLAFGGVRTFLRRGGKGGEDEAMITLHLSDR